MCRRVSFAATRLAVALACLLIAGGVRFAADGPSQLIVLCAPGYPGTTESAQATMDLFAEAVASVMRWPKGRLGAEYQPTIPGGLSRMADAPARLAIVPLPLFLEQAQALGLKPRLLVARSDEGRQIWSLVTGISDTEGAVNLDGFEIVSIAGYSERFVRQVTGGAAKVVPAKARVVFSGELLPALRRAAAGEKVALLLDQGQTNALAALPFAQELTTAARSVPLPEGIVCELPGRENAASDRLIDALLGLHETEQGAAALAAMRIRRFLPLDAAGLEQVRRQFERAGE